MGYREQVAKKKKIQWTSNHLGSQTQERQGFSLRVPVGTSIARRLLDRRKSDHGKFEEVEYAEGKKDISSGNHAFG